MLLIARFLWKSTRHVVWPAPIKILPKYGGLSLTWLRALVPDILSNTAVKLFFKCSSQQQPLLNKHWQGKNVLQEWLTVLGTWRWQSPNESVFQPWLSSSLSRVKGCSVAREQVCGILGWKCPKERLDRPLGQPSHFTMKNVRLRRIRMQVYFHKSK